ncbi:3-deoxy-D-manno-octulosonic acid transferase [Helicobacter pylori]|uniref:lipid IV(A) 3-deoxy-D-manno-octulosonic acid transferase n=1 Tax=Helicobacter pylori TaxID=210 RepID=UPI000EABC3E8|nr:lipid IV(A) 3-deoxy-D-manno-octulosonic acid transferase [Helicobacter pylori]RKV20974.1 3-deoxy-D-manno-octulosonic acid transferase [Helicobacter pylori]
MFKFFYLLLLTLGHLLGAPFIFFWSFKEKYRHSLKARFFLKDNLLKSEPTFWFHACSYGEVKSLEPIIQALKEPILISVTTNTGFELAAQTYQHSQHIEVRYLPFETLLFAWKKNLKRLKTLVVTEAELWFNMFDTAQKLGAKTMLINARISVRSYPKYQRFSFFYALLFKRIDLILAQSKDDQKRLLNLGAKKVVDFLNIKRFSKPVITSFYPKNPSALNIVLASTHEGEEELGLKAFLELKKTFKNARLIVVPRHPERFKSVQNLLQDILKTTPFSLECFSSKGFVECDILLVDSLGELNNFYAIADIVILGGSFVKMGGHNPLEPAFFNTRLITGEYLFNQVALFELIKPYKIVPKEDLLDALLDYKNLGVARFLDNGHDLNELLAFIKH